MTIPRNAFAFRCQSYRFHHLQSCACIIRSFYDVPCNVTREIWPSLSLLQHFLKAMGSGRRSQCPQRIEKSSSHFVAFVHHLTDVFNRLLERRFTGPVAESEQSHSLAYPLGISLGSQQNRRIYETHFTKSHNQQPLTAEDLFRKYIYIIRYHTSIIHISTICFSKMGKPPEAPKNHPSIHWFRGHLNPGLPASRESTAAGIVWTKFLGANCPGSLSTGWEVGRRFTGKRPREICIKLKEDNGTENLEENG